LPRLDEPLEELVDLSPDCGRSQGFRSWARGAISKDVSGLPGFFVFSSGAARARKARLAAPPLKNKIALGLWFYKHGTSSGVSGRSNVKNRDATKNVRGA